MVDVENIGEREVNPLSHSIQTADLEEKWRRNKVEWSAFYTRREDFYTKLGEKDGGEEI